MSDIAIRVDGLGKQYHLGGQRERYHTFADQIKKWTSLRRLYSRARRAESNPPFWALKDVSFEVKRGEVVGIIGRNGAGKSTLLKILSRITEPTEGEATIYGRVGSLLEVGTGFHPELTGRENIFLNGAILGMKRSEILRKFDEIVAFAEVEKFIDTPTKHYSSGMYMRLAFAVAAHLEPEILVVDEVLAVGDAQFQKKCLGKMGEVAKGGRTVLFVSHDMTAIQRLCTRTVLLVRGHLTFSGITEKCIEAYMHSATTRGTCELGAVGLNQGSFRFLDVTLRDLDGQRITTVRLMQPFQICIRFVTHQQHSQLIVGVGIHAQNDFTLFATHTNDAGKLERIGPGLWEVAATISPNYLREGQYFLSLGAIDGCLPLAHVPRALELEIEAFLDDSSKYYDRRIGALFIPMAWSIPTQISET